MKKFLSLLIVVVLIFSCSVTVFASDSSVSNTAKAESRIYDELNKITNKVDRDKIEQLLFTPIYGTFLEGKSSPVDETDSFVKAIQSLNQYSGEKLDRQIAKLLKSTIESKMEDPSISFSKEALALAKQYCPEELDNIKSKTVELEIYTEQSPSMATSSYAWQTYYKTGTYQWRNFGNWLMYQLSLTIDWGTDGNGQMAYIGVADRDYVEVQGMTDFRTWCDGDYVNKYTYSGKAYQEAYFMRANGAPAYPAITVTVQNTGAITATGNNVL